MTFETVTIRLAGDIDQGRQLIQQPGLQTGIQTVQRSTQPVDVPGAHLTRREGVTELGGAVDYPDAFHNPDRVTTSGT